MKRISTLLLIAFSCLIPGNFNAWFGLFISFLVYSFCLIIIGYLYQEVLRNSLSSKIFLFVVFLLFPVNAWIGDKDYWFPIIAPTFVVIGIFSFFSAHLLHHFRDSKLTYICPTFLIFALAAAFFKIEQLSMESQVNLPKYQQLIGVKPSFSFMSLDGKLVDDTTFNDKIVLVDFGFLECATCAEKHIVFDSLARHYAQNKKVAFLYVINGQINKMLNVKNILGKKKYAFHVLYDADGKFEKSYLKGNNGYPIELRINRNKKIFEVINGFSFTSDQYFIQTKNTIDNNLEK